MKRFLQRLAIAGLAFSMPSCGLIGPLGRSTTRMVQGVGELLGPAASAAAAAAL